MANHSSIWCGWGHVRRFIMPLGCFAFIAFYALLWPRCSKSEGLIGVSTVKGH